MELLIAIIVELILVVTTTSNASDTEIKSESVKALENASKIENVYEVPVIDEVTAISDMMNQAEDWDETVPAPIHN